MMSRTFPTEKYRDGFNVSCSRKLNLGALLFCDYLDFDEFNIFDLGNRKREVALMPVVSAN